MTEEQIKALKPGDKFIVEYTVRKKDDFNVDTAVFLNEMFYALTFETECAALKTAKLVTQPPTFEIGDTVSVIRDPLTGTAYNDTFLLPEYVGKTGIVQCAKDAYGILEVDMGDAEENGFARVNIHCLELVKKAVKDKYHTCGLLSGDYSVKNEDGGVVAIFDATLHPDAEAAAKAERDRLNAEWHKLQEQKGGAE